MARPEVLAAHCPVAHVRSATLLLAMLLAVGGCHEATGALVRVSPEAGLVVDTLQVDVVGRDANGGTLAVPPQSYPVAATAAGWEESVAVLAGSQYGAGADVLVVGLRQGVEVARGGVAVDFSRGSVADAAVTLYAACRGVYCADRSFCGEGGACSSQSRRLDFTVNSAGAGDQRDPAVASLGATGWVVSWVDASAQPPQVYLRRFGPDGAPLDADDVQIEQSSLEQQSPTLAAASAVDAFAVAWAETPGGGVHVRRYYSGGQPLGQTESPTTSVGGEQTLPALGANPSSFLLAWTDTEVQSGVGTSVRFRRGNWIAGWVDLAPDYVATSPSVSEQRPAVCGSCGGSETFLVAWQDSSGADPDPSGTQVRGRWISGTPAGGGETILDTTTTGDQINPTAASSGSLGLAAWEDRGVSPPAIRGRLCTPGSSYITPEVMLAPTSDSAADAWPAVGVAGNVVLVAWQGPPPDDPTSDTTVILARRFDHNGAAIDTSPFAVATSRGGNQQLPRVAGSDTAFAIVWMEYVDGAAALWDVRARVLGVADAP